MYEEEREWLSDVQDLLREEGVEADLLSRPGVSVWEGGIDRFVDLYQLRQLAAYLENGRDIAPILASTSDTNGDVDLDPLLESIWEGEHPSRFVHLINHQGEGGYYLPVEFAEPIWLEFDSDEEPEETDEDEEESQVVSFGSSVALQRELVELDTLLTQANVPTKHAAYRCMTVLREAVGQSVSNDLPIVIW